MNEKGDRNEEIPDDLATARKKRRLLRKIDLFILPLLVMVYFSGSMACSDLGNAQIARMDKRLKLSAQDYSNAANTFLFGYIVFQLLGTLLVRKIGLPNQFALAVILWVPFLNSVRLIYHLIQLAFSTNTLEVWVDSTFEVLCTLNRATGTFGRYRMGECDQFEVH